MKITKYEHSFMVLEQNDEQLVIDPGTYSPNLPELQNVVGIIVTHEHADHLSATNLTTILQANPAAPLYAPQDVLDQLTDVGGNKVTSRAGETVALGSFKVEFVGGDHAIIYKTSPCENTGLLINDVFYTPGDSLSKPKGQVKVLAVPAHAPWMKTSETMDYITELGPEVVFPVHNMLLSDIGEMVTYRWLKQAADEAGADWQVLASGDSLEV
jgi:L-ascorbate metabolism protein UlaG (beta-lactamase superfamily)